MLVNPIALRKAKIVYNFGLSECNWVKARVRTHNKFSWSRSSMRLAQCLMSLWEGFLYFLQY